MVKRTFVALAILCALVPSAAPSSAFAGQRRRAKKPSAERRAPEPPAEETVPVPCGLWRPANPGVETDTFAFDFSSGLDEVFLVGPPISWSLVRDGSFVESPWVKGPNIVIMFRLEGIEPKLAGDMLYVVDHGSVLYRIRPASTGGYWRFEGVYSSTQTHRIASILDGASLCTTAKGTE